MEQTEKLEETSVAFHREVQILRTQVWATAVSLHTGMNAYQLKGTDLPGSWDRYLAGTRTVEDFGPESIVKIVEMRYPGTAKWFRSVLWFALCSQMSEEMIVNGFKSLDPVIPPRFLRRCQIEQEQQRLIVFWEDEHHDFLVKLGSIDALIATLLLIRQSEAIESPLLRHIAICICQSLKRSVDRIPEIQKHASSLYSIIGRAFPIHEYVNVAHRHIWAWKFSEDGSLSKVEGAAG